MSPELEFFYKLCKWSTVFILGFAFGCVVNSLGRTIVVGFWCISVILLFIGLLFDYQERK